MVRLPVPSAFNADHVRAFKMTINKAEVMLMMATITISRITTTTLVSSNSNQEKISGTSADRDRP